MTFVLYYSQKAIDDLAKLEKHLGRRIKKKIDFYSQQKNPFQYAKKLKNSPLAEYRFRIEDYRALFDVDHQGIVSILHIIHVKHRKDIYQLEN